jgi:hypothetical protein
MFQHVENAEKKPAPKVWEKQKSIHIILYLIFVQIYTLNCLDIKNIYNTLIYYGYTSWFTITVDVICNNVKFLLEFLKRNKKLSTQHVFLNKERDITLQFNQVKTTKFVTSINVEQPPSDFINLNLCYCWTNNNVTVTLERRNMEELFEQEITEKLLPEMEKEEVEEITANVSKQKLFFSV